MMLKIFEQLEVFYRHKKHPRMKPPRFASFTEDVRRPVPFQHEMIHDIRATWGVRTSIKDEAEKPRAIEHARKMLARDLLSDARDEVIDCLELLYAEGFRSDDPVFEKLDRLSRLLAGEELAVSEPAPA
jgi:hypothetical protein